MIDNPDDSPDLLARPPARGAGVRRLNRIPLFIVIGIACAVLLLLVYTASQRSRSNMATGMADDSGNKGPVASSSPPQLADAPESGVIPPAVVGPTIDPTTGAAGAPGAPQQVVVRQRPPNPYEQDWARYNQQRLQVAQAREGAFMSALNAPTGVQLASQRTSGAPAGTGAAPAPAGLDPATLAAFGGIPGGAAPRSAAAAGGLPADNDSQFNGQDAKRDFLTRRSQESNYSPAMRTAVVSPYEMKAGTVIPAVMIGGINSDLPGQILGQVSENVYDTKTGRYLLIPQGSKLVGTYDNSVTMGQNRVLVVWKRVIFPDASSLDLDMMPGADQGGYAGFRDQVNNHYGKIFGSALMLSLFSAGIQVSQPRNSSILTNPDVGQTAAGAVGQQLGQVGTQLMQRNLRIQPTLEIRPGYRFNVEVTKDLIIQPWRR
ncbi:TrbI/VirB10 family protein [Sphingobium cloacae]|uniref:TrbI/VirB10 family protein n=1 Tax=Sphingobium cloacae TaxID=120107 RepID=UPI000F4EEEAC|nr:TrbI/VirB10 family protein [Sphingobium cloacae]